MGTNDEMVALVGAILIGMADLASWTWADGTDIDDVECQDLLALVHYVRGRREAQCLRARMAIPQRRAMRLLRSMLSDDQAVMLRRRRHFCVQGISGAMYRLSPCRGLAERIELHGKRWFTKTSYCLHDADDADRMPSADVTIGHMLLILADEPAFLATANHYRCDDQLWNRDYLRRIRGRHRMTEAQAS